MRKSIMHEHDAFSVKINSFLTSKDKMAIADEEKKRRHTGCTSSVFDKV